MPAWHRQPAGDRRKDDAEQKRVVPVDNGAPGAASKLLVICYDTQVRNTSTLSTLVRRGGVGVVSPAKIWLCGWFGKEASSTSRQTEMDLRSTLSSYLSPRSPRHRSSGLVYGYQGCQGRTPPNSSKIEI